MKLSKLFIALFLSIGFISCSEDDTLINNDQELKSYELVSVQWKLNTNDGQSIVEKKIPEFYFRNDSDTIMEIVIEPLKNIQGSSIFKFNDSLTFTGLNYLEVQVSIPEELSLLSGEYSYLGGGVKVPLAQEESSFPFSWYFKDTFALNQRSTLTSNYTVFLRKNKASFLATFRETTTGETLELDGTWTGLFFNNLEGESVADGID
ncbi:hypothetical protein JM83_1903 [Gillisia sp. Hel_I_86]|uniref:hypothetical protein n=1 Tax=Gillisia sp. Hel_I_86 TaxID=1249981 RepID=UPI00119C27CB|nr:hypothetical protein [Gillisia sp. Hel_I_86]TVZ26904.1 hypothetical protein JM83_1903 [Gillisia sp. Hel_I_86]